MRALVRVADRARANEFDMENFVAREVAAPAVSAGAPQAAGGYLSTN
jgi:hypothetical protein